MNFTFIKFFTNIPQKIMIAIATNLIFKLLKNILLWLLTIITIIIIGLVLVQYSGLYDVYGLLMEKFPIIENMVNIINTKIKLSS